MKTFQHMNFLIEMKVILKFLIPIIHLLEFQI